MTTGIDITTAHNEVHVVGHNKAGKVINERIVPVNSTETFYAHAEQSITITELPKPDAVQHDNQPA